jgi:para-nitrobenzyl esterase
MILLRRLFVWAVAAVCLAPVLLYGAEGVTSMSAPSDDKTGVIVNAPAGAMEGRREGELRVFKGIPYALPPVGPARWRPPAPMPRWVGVKKATEFGAACWQPKPTLSNIYTRGPMPMSEDCLTLNIWTPVHADNAPVFFWIHGGALVGGGKQGGKL